MSKEILSSKTLCRKGKCTSTNLTIFTHVTLTLEQYVIILSTGRLEIYSQALIFETKRKMIPGYVYEY
jgi:hypothetical protein